MGCFYTEASKYFIGMVMALMTVMVVVIVMMFVVMAAAAVFTVFMVVMMFMMVVVPVLVVVPAAAVLTVFIVVMMFMMVVVSVLMVMPAAAVLIVFMMLMIVMMCVSFLCKSGKLCFQRILLLHRFQNLRAGNFLPRRCNNRCLLIVPANQLLAFIQFFPAHTCSVAENNGTCMFQLIIVKLAKVLHIHLSLLGVHHCSESVEYKLIAAYSLHR